MSVVDTTDTLPLGKRLILLTIVCPNMLRMVYTNIVLPPFPLSLGARSYLCAVGSSFDDAEPRRARQHLAPLLLSIWLPLVAESDQQPSLPTMPLVVPF